jgi:uncharacterized membrane protein
MSSSDAANGADTIVLAPNCSLSTRAAVGFFSSVCALSLGCGAAFALRGYWPVLPFAGLEMLLLAVALRISLQRGRYMQTIRISDTLVEVETRRGALLEQMVFTRHWAQVKLRRARTPWHPSQLMLQSHGRACELGSFLTEAARRALAERLRRLVGGVNESPPLGRPDCNIKV